MPPKKPPIGGKVAKPSLLNKSFKSKHIVASSQKMDPTGKGVIHAQQVAQSRFYGPKPAKTRTSTTLSLTPQQEGRLEQKLSKRTKDIHSGNKFTVPKVHATKIEVKKVNPRGQDANYSRVKPVDLGPTPTRTHIKFGTHDMEVKSYNKKDVNHLEKVT